MLCGPMPSWNRGPGLLKDHMSTEAYRNHMFEQWKYWRGTEWPVMKTQTALGQADTAV